MSVVTSSPTQRKITYPDSDGQPMADNTLQFRWIATLQGGLDALYRDDPDVFVAGDLLWYPVEGNNTLRTAPDVMVAFGRPKGYRGSYRQWEEGDVAPQVVFEILSPGNRPADTIRKFQFYDQYGVEEYYVYDPDHETFSGWLRRDGSLQEIAAVDGWISPRLGVRFDLGSGTLQVLRPNGRPLATYVELAEESDAARQRAEQERQRAEQERQRAEQEHARSERLAAQLRAAGIAPEA
jgi:Uma2 family endonuclease